MMFVLLFCLFVATEGQTVPGWICQPSFCLEEGYSTMDLPPGRDQGQPFEVFTVMSLEELFDVDAYEHTMHLKVWVEFYWIDERVRMNNGKESEQVKWEDVQNYFWTPDLYIYHVKSTGGGGGVGQTDVNGLTLSQLANKSVEINLNMEINTFVVCSMDFHSFPFNTNVCKFEVSSFGHNRDRMRFISASSQPDSGLNKELISEYEMEVSYLTGNDTQVDEGDSGGVFSVVGLKIRLKTVYMKYIWVYYLPTTMFTLTSWFSFLLPPTSYPARTSILVTIFLCQVNVVTMQL